MNTQLKARLEIKIQEWIDENCEEDYWPQIWMGDFTVELMATAAMSVFNACQDSQEYAEREGYTK